VANAVAQATYIILSEQVEGTEHLVVLDVKGPCSLEVSLECKHRWWLNVELLGRAHLAELLLALLSRDPRRPPRPAAVMVVRMRIKVLWVVLTAVVEELRHVLMLCRWQFGWNVVGEGWEVTGQKWEANNNNKGETKGFDSSDKA
jgi:hypothetical protein